MSQKKYWKGLEELHNTPAHQETVANEFKDSPLPLSDLSDTLLGATTPRRDFLKYLGFSTAAAMLAASCEMPVRKVIPYAIKPEDIVPGVPNYYASTFVDGGDYCPIVVKTRDGRPIKIEGNELSSITRGGTSARVQASVLSLYDAARLRQPYADGKKVDTFAPIDRSVMDGLAAGKTIYILTGTILSPTVKEVIAQFIAKYPNTKHVVYDPMSFSGMLLANEASYGKRTLPSYHFDKAHTIVSLDADFLGTWLSPVEFARAYSNGRKISAKNLQMSKHYQIEGMQTLTGANADYRATARPSQMGAVAVALYNAVTTGAAPALESKHLNETIARAAADLKKGNGMVVCGTNNVAVQTVVNAINDKIGANGTTINWAVTSNYKQGIDADMVNLVADVKAGNVSALLIHGNPVYEYMDGAAFGDAIRNIPVTVSFADRMDETASKCKYVVPDHHFLESWGDAEPKPGYYSLIQPGIAPIFKTRSFADSLLTWAGSTTTYGDMWKSFWIGKLGSQEAFDQALQDGVIEPGGRISDMASSETVSTATGEEDTTSNSGARVMPAMNSTTSMTMGGALFGGNVAGAISAIAAMRPASGKDLVIYQKVGIGHGGCWSNNPWLQELPDPITKATWDNYACISPKHAKDLDAGKGIDLEVTSINEVDENKRVVKVTVNGKSMELPALVVPGMHNDVVAIAVGYGRIKSVGRVAADLGKNAYPLRVWNGQTFECASTGATVAKTKITYPVAITQTHHSYEGRGIIREFTLADFAKQPDFLLNERAEEIGHYAHLPWVGHDEANNGHGSAQNGSKNNGEHAAKQNSATMTAPHGDGHMTDPDQGGAHASNFEEGFRENGTLYPNYEHLGIHWGMSIDLTSCIGCGACVIGCQSENNVSVVGKDKVMKAQEMHWITVDRYFTGMPDEPDTIQTVFQPMLCQHCDNAPCENVCPVSATNHSSEGLNQMAYNRCIGTKYCANNCPYKVRHFNWMDWNGADCFDDNLYEDGRRDDINDDLTRMVLNPDVTVRSRGVMEKCSFCVQRLQEGKLAAKKDNRPLRDGEVRTACQQACPTEAIVFGNVNDKNSAVYKLRHQQQMERKYYVLEEIHSLPNVNYLSKIRNTDEVVGGSPKDGLMKESI
jgi:molybdopterin-containing oxidoreductase family iron-sulfur binding subunit